MRGGGTETGAQSDGDEETETRREKDGASLRREAEEGRTGLVCTHGRGESGSEAQPEGHGAPGGLGANEH